jgi:V/A-type H+-transporting ATPase subunit A
VTDSKKSDYFKAFLHQGSEIESVMKVIGEEGTTLSDYISYLKAFMLDAVYLQQNSFDQIDTCCSKARQRYLSDKLILVLGSDYALTNKDDARKYFNRMRQRFIDWNYVAFESEEFKKAEEEIDKLYFEGEGKLSREAEILLKGGEI